MAKASGAVVRAPYLPDSGDHGFHVERYDLELDYRVATNRLSGTAVVSAVANRRIDDIRLDLVGLRVTKIALDGARPSWSQTRTKVVVRFALPVESGERFSLAVSYTGTPRPRRSAWGEVGWEELSDGVLVAAQPHGAATWFPCNDRPSDKSVYRIAVTTESTHRVVANGVLVERAPRASRTRWVHESPEPMSTYLATVQIGRYRETELASGIAPQQVVHHPAGLDLAVTRAFARQPRMMELFERLFGPYPFEEYAVVVTDDELEIPLEAQGLSVFGRNHLTAASERLIAHELAHSWFGNSLTAASWQHIWLHEGFACYAEWLWSERSGGATVERLAGQHLSYLAGLPQDLLVGDPGPADLFDDRVYKRGALTLHAVRRMLGDRPFFAMLAAWVADNRHASVDTEGFVRHAASYSADPGRVAATVDEWLLAPRLPKLPTATAPR